MHKFSIVKYKKFSELPFHEFDNLKFSVYIIDFQWNYLFVNDFVRKNLGARGEGLVRSNMWTAFPELAKDSVFMLLKSNMEKGITTNLVTTSPLNGKRLNISGYVLDDCYYFSSSILPDKDDLLNEIRNELKRGRPLL
jgi:hypothetical protein